MKTQATRRPKVILPSTSEHLKRGSLLSWKFGVNDVSSGQRALQQPEKEELMYGTRGELQSAPSKQGPANPQVAQVSLLCSQSWVVV